MKTFKVFIAYRSGRSYEFGDVESTRVTSGLLSIVCKDVIVSIPVDAIESVTQERQDEN